MKVCNVALAVALGLACGSAAVAQVYNPYKPPPLPRTNYDYQSGNMTTTTPTPGGGARVQGTNIQTGSMWNTEIKPNGNQSGTDASGNFWTYNAASKTYTNTNGTLCTGSGVGRVCN